jgi:hypothetical protein
MIEGMRNAGVTTANFGAGAKDTVEVTDNIKVIKAKLLSEVYKVIVSLFSLTNKSQYRYVALSVFRLYVRSRIISHEVDSPVTVIVE